jgi:hypothetical protein
MTALPFPLSWHSASCPHHPGCVRRRPGHLDPKTRVNVSLVSDVEQPHRMQSSTQIRRSVVPQQNAHSLTALCLNFILFTGPFTMSVHSRRDQLDATQIFFQLKTMGRAVHTWKSDSLWKLHEQVTFRVRLRKRKDESICRVSHLNMSDMIRQRLFENQLTTGEQVSQRFTPCVCLPP